MPEAKIQPLRSAGRLTLVAVVLACALAFASNDAVARTPRSKADKQARATPGTSARGKAGRPPKGKSDRGDKRRGAARHGSKSAQGKVRKADLSAKGRSASPPAKGRKASPPAKGRKASPAARGHKASPAARGHKASPANKRHRASAAGKRHKASGADKRSRAGRTARSTERGAAAGGRRGKAAERSVRVSAAGEPESGERSAKPERRDRAATPEAPADAKARRAASPTSGARPDARSKRAAPADEPSEEEEPEGDDPPHAAPSNRPEGELPFVAAPDPEKAGGQGGVGMVVDGRDQAIVVARVVQGGPAARAGVQAGDMIVAVDGWRVPARPRSADVAGRIRGKVGSTVVVRVLRGQPPQPLALSVTRGSLKALFPARASQVLYAAPGAALLASSERYSLGVSFAEEGRVDRLIRYNWAVGPRDRALSDSAVERGHGAVAWSRGGATIQVADWRLELKPIASSGQMMVSASSLPVAAATTDTWLDRDPRTATYVTPRGVPRVYRQIWPSGGCEVRLKVTVDGKPAPGRRLCLDLQKGSERPLPTASTETDARGETSLSLPLGTYRVTALHGARSGGRPDLYFEARVPDAGLTIECAREGRPVAVNLALLTGPDNAATAGAPALPAEATRHRLVGHSLPDLHVREWLGTRKLPANLKGRAMLLYLWATWCGPCKRVSPMIAELDARLGSQGLVTVAASVDRDEMALSDYVDGLRPGAAPVAWLGPEGLETLGARGIPTAIAVDHRGIVQAVHTGTGVTLQAWQKLFERLLHEANVVP